MPNRLIEIFEDEKLVEKIKRRLPYLFRLAELESSRAGKTGMEVGSVRERILVALLIYKFGEANVETEIPITEPEIDAKLFEKPVSIKTITGKSFGGVKLIWTVDTQKAKEFREGYYPHCDILLVQINWNDVGGFYYIPLEVQKWLFDKIGRKPYIPLHAFIVEDMLDLKFLMRGEIIWNKASSGSPSTAWGSWLSAKNPTLRDIHEYILVFSKGMFNRGDPKRKNTISKEEFLEFTKSVWTFSAEPATKVGHPAPFPVELPYRLIQLYTFEGEVVLDPFIGSGQAAIAAIKTRRHYVGYDINEEYVKLAERRIKDFSLSFNAPKLF